MSREHPPSRLDLVSPEGKSPPVRIAETWNGWDALPGLWLLLLADARHAAADAAPDPACALQVCVWETVKRIRFLAQVAQSHPLAHRIPELPLYLDGVACHLLDSIGAFPWRERSRLLLVVRDDAGEVPDEAVLDRAAALWNGIVDLAEKQQWHLLDRVLGFDAGRLAFEQWRAWIKRFGLDTLFHPYFSRLEIDDYHEGADVEAPDAITYREFERAGRRTLWRALGDGMRALLPGGAGREEREDASGDGVEACESGNAVEDDWQGSGFRTVRINGKVGLRFIADEARWCHGDMDPDDYVDDAPDRLALAADWDDILYHHVDRAWVCRDGRWGLLELRRQCALLMAPCCDRVVQDPDSPATYVVDGGRCGIICVQRCAWLVPAEYDEMVWQTDGGPCSHGFWSVRSGRHWGVLDPDGAILHACVLDVGPEGHVDESRADWGGFGLRIVQAGKVGWMQADGDIHVACEWDEVVPTGAKGLYKVRRAGRWGLLASGNRLWIPCEYLSVEPLALARDLQQPHFDGGFDWCPGDDGWPDEANVADLVASVMGRPAALLIAVRTERGMGVVDQAHRVVVPIGYARVEAAQNGVHRDPRWVVLRAHDERMGLWCVATGAEAFPCTHAWLEMFVAQDIDQPLVGTVDDGRYRLWNADRSPAFPGAYLWLGGPKRQHRGDLADGLRPVSVRGDIARAWSQGQPAQALPDGPGATLVDLQPGHAVMDRGERLAWQFAQSGDRRAALALARECLDNGKDAEARAWAARACGFEAAPVGANRPPEDEHGEPDGDFIEEAAILFAGMLDEGRGGKRDAALARAWAQNAVAHRSAHWAQRETRLLLGKLLLDPDAGPIDGGAAMELLDDIDYPSLDEGKARFYQAQWLSRQNAPDLERVRSMLQRADACAVPGAATQLAALLDTLAVGAGAAEATLLRREAAYYRAKALGAAEDR